MNRPYRIDANTLLLPAPKAGSTGDEALAALASDIRTRWQARPGRALKVTVKEARNIRTRPQNALYWVAYVPALRQMLSDTSGMEVTDEEAHEFAKARFLRGRELADPVTGEVIKLPASTTKLDRAEFGAYLDRIADLVREFGGIEIGLTEEDLDQDR